MSKKKAVITILGLISTTKKNPNKTQVSEFIPKAQEDKALYEVEENLKSLLNPPKANYINMFPLLVDTFQDRKIVAISTTQSEKIQKDVLIFENLSHTNIEYKSINENEDYHSTFATINQVLNDYDKVIIDLSHGFRHFPLLTLIALLVQNIKDTDKIEAILFAQEIEKDKKYKIINLIEYLDIATLSYALSSFNQNYTLANKDNLRTENFKNLFETLSKFSEAILANSLKSIFENNLIDDILKTIKSIEETQTFLKDANLLEDVKKHLLKIKELSNQDDYKKYFDIAKILLKRGYILNSITILNEALPLYLHKKFDELYILHTEAKNTSYNTLKSITDFLKTEEPIKKLFVEDKVNNSFYCANYEVFNSIYFIYEELKTIRNDLAHANGEKTYENIKNQIKSIFSKFEDTIIKDNIANNLRLGIDKNSKYARYNKKEFEAKIEKKYQKLFPEEQDNPNSTKKILKDDRAYELKEKFKNSSSLEKKEFINLVCGYWNNKTNKIKKAEIIDKFYSSKLIS